MNHFYNDNDAGAAAWLRQLAADGLIPKGTVDDRSIEKVRPRDLAGVVQAHFFAGIGGWPLALQLAGWPATRPVWTASLPCQPFSVAGKRQGAGDDRHLWPVFVRLVRKCRPPVLFGEQVASPDGLRWLAGVRADLEAEGYAVGGADLPAACVGAPHRRQRLFWCASRLADAEHAERRPEHEIDSETPRRDRPRRRGPTRGLADAGHLAAGGGLGAAGQQDAGERRLAGADDREGGAVRGLVNADGRGRERGKARPAQERSRRNARPKQAGELPERVEGPSGRRAGELADAPGVMGRGGSLGDADGPGLGEHGGAEPIRAPQPAAELRGDARPWDDFAVVACADGFLRRVEPGVHPLASRIPGRVGLIRGYGNAIVPQVAALFIQAAMQALDDGA